MNIQTQKEGYLDLIKIGLSDLRKKELIEFINGLNDYNGDEIYFTTLNFVMSYLDKNRIHFIMSLDWKQEILDLNWRINSSTNDNFNLEIKLPEPTNYGENKSVSSPNVFKDYDNALRKENFQLSFFDTESDEYVIIVHKIENEQMVKNAIKKIGYNCLNTNSLII